MSLRSQLSKSKVKLDLNMMRLTRLRGTIVAVLTVFALYFLCFQRLPQSHLLAHTLTPRLLIPRPTYHANDLWKATLHHPLSARQRFGVVSMVYGPLNQNYEEALKRHQQYTARHGYEAYILRSRIVQQPDDVWSKLAYLLYIVLLELQRDPRDRVQWLMWVDADSIIINPALPLDIFLPPDDFPHVHVLATRDQNGLNAGMLFIHVHEWSIRMLARALSLPDHFPELFLTTVPRKLNEQDALAYVFNESDWRESVLYQPRTWWNAYQWSHAFEGRPGDMFVHFAGLERDVRNSTMRGWLEVVKGSEAKKWELPIEKTQYPEMISSYWHALRRANRTLDESDAALTKAADRLPALETSRDLLGLALLNATDQPDLLSKLTENVQVELGRLEQQLVQEV